MAWPPAALPTNRTNATPQQGTHPDDHNRVNQAVNDTVGQVGLLGNQLQQVRSAVHAVVNGIAVGPVGPADGTAYTVLSYTAQRSGLLLFNGTFGVSYVDGDFATIDMSLVFLGGHVRTNRQVLFGSGETVITFVLSEAVTVSAGQVLSVSITRINGAARYQLVATPAYNGATIADGLFLS